MDYPKNLAAALCRIYDEVGVAVLKKPDKLSAVFVDIAPNLKAERNQIELLISSGCLKKLVTACSLSPAESKALAAAAVDTLCETYLMDRSKAEILCSTYMEALRGKEYEVVAAQPPHWNEQPAAALFHLQIEDVFAIAEHRIVVTGYVSGSPVRTGDAVTVVKKNGQKISATVFGIESNQKIIDHANPGLAVGIALSDLKVTDVDRGDTLVARNCKNTPLEPKNVGSFQLVVDGSFDIKGRGAVVTGWVTGGSVHLFDKVALIKKNGQVLASSVAGIERYRKLLDYADPGDAVGLLLTRLKSKQIEVGDKVILR